MNTVAARVYHGHLTRAERDAKENLRAICGRFLKEQEPAKKDEAGHDLIRAIFGKDAIVEDPIL